MRLELAEKRNAGAPFDTAWQEALQAAVRGRERTAWLEALDATAAVWMRAYERLEPTRAERAIHAAAVDPDRERIPGDGERLCELCFQPMPASRRSHARYCSHACQRAANSR